MGTRYSQSLHGSVELLLLLLLLFDSVAGHSLVVEEGEGQTAII